jgi:chromosome segregation ATPase
MISLVNKSQQSPPRRDDRGAIRAAISRVKDAQDALAGHKAAIKRANELLARAEKKVEKAKLGIEQAKGEAARLLAHAISRGDDDADSNGVIRAARAAETTAFDEIESLRAAVEQLKTQAVEYEAKIVEAEVGIAIAIRELIAPRVREALARLRALDAESTPHMALLHFAIEGDGQRVPSSSSLGTTVELRLQGRLDAPLAEVRKEIERFFGGRIDANNWWPVVETWQNAARELRTDPDAILPG